MIQNRIAQLIESAKSHSGESNSRNRPTIVPFFDIEFHNIAKYCLDKNTTEDLMKLFRVNIEVLECIFGFNFEGQPFLRNISNTSLQPINTVFPDLKTMSPEDDFEMIVLNSKKAQLLEHPSAILSENQARSVALLVGFSPSEVCQKYSLETPLLFEPRWNILSYSGKEA